MNSTFAPPSMRNNSPNRVTLLDHLPAKFREKRFEILQGLNALLDGPLEADLDQGRIHVPLVDLNDLVNRIHPSCLVPPFSLAIRRNPGRANSREALLEPEL